MIVRLSNSVTVNPYIYQQWQADRKEVRGREGIGWWKSEGRSVMERITDDEVEVVMNKLNHRPRKTLKFKTPHSVFFADTLQEAA